MYIFIFREEQLHLEVAFFTVAVPSISSASFLLVYEHFGDREQFTDLFCYVNCYVNYFLLKSGIKILINIVITTTIIALKLIWCFLSWQSASQVLP